MAHRIEDFQNDPSWKLSIGEKLRMIHFRNGHYHAECDQNTGICKIHYDEHDPYESPISLVKHMLQSPLGALVLGTSALLVGDAVLNDGKIRKKATKFLFG